MPVRYQPRGETASTLAADVEEAVRRGTLVPGERLPTVRGLAGELSLSPVTVASAYRELRLRGLVVADGRRGTRVAWRPPLPTRQEPPPPGLHDLASGNPDPRLLPPLRGPLSRLDSAPVLYGDPAKLPALVEAARRRFAADGVAADSIAVTGGALDGIERVLAAHLRPGDRVAVEDPGFTRAFDLLGALGLAPVPVPVDDAGLLPDGLERALAGDALALLVTPRAQNPTGAALDPGRARELARVLRRHPDALLIEDDHVGAVAGAAAVTLSAGRARWAVVRSVSKTLGPDLRVALVAGDASTIARVEGRQLVGPGWVSHVLQGLVSILWSDPETDALLDRAERAYAERRSALVRALADRGVEAHGSSGLNVWVPVPAEVPAVRALEEAGYAAAAGERFRLASGPAIRITTAALDPSDAPAVAEALAQSLCPCGLTHAS